MATGVAYREYFASPELMFPALVKDQRLRQKDLIFGVRVPGGVKAWPLATLADGAVINDHIGFIDVVVIGDASGRGARAYEGRRRRFARGASPDELLAGDVRWRVTESALVGPGGESLPRLPAHVAYWFAWAGYYENALLVGWIQAAIIAFFAMVYALSPKAFPPGTLSEPVPWTLAIYAGFTTARIFLAYRGQLRHGLVALSVLIA